MTGKYFMITANKSELKDDDNMMFINTRSRYSTNNKYDWKYDPSGVVVLYICVLNR